MIIGAAYLRCSDPRQDKSVEQQREVIAQRAAQDGVHIPPENWFHRRRHQRPRRPQAALLPGPHPRG